MERIDFLWLGTGPLVFGGFRIDSGMIRVDSNPLAKPCKTFERTLNRFQGMNLNPYLDAKLNAYTRFSFVPSSIQAQPLDILDLCCLFQPPIHQHPPPTI
ncbi:hypothetical protein PIB30_026475 [Stylosanthes scabra]|uniref:Uncharacterized protein n=1 Tax=Stylosanthes scabra TaxID=79078 RepID=A0ABU6WAJ8_9FABA|nr:hypothetical protein [Stylosanthes scabra]